jgi:hypothetical protein
MLRFKMEKLLERKDLYWRQRAKVHWLNNGDRNTKFFHQYALVRRRRSRISKLVKENGVVVEEGISSHIPDFYKKLFTATTGSRMDELLQQVSGRVTEEMNNTLLQPFTAEEVKSGLDAIGDLKAPGSDGMTSLFYKRFWEIVGEDVTKEVLGFLNGGILPRAWNETVIVLIPKTANPESLKDVSSISLCIVLYKIASKVLASQLKPPLDVVISPNQSSFIPGRLITDNVLVAYEVTHFLKNKRTGNDCYAALKLDMSKAYDIIEWHSYRT